MERFTFLDSGAPKKIRKDVILFDIEENREFLWKEIENHTKVEYFDFLNANLSKELEEDLPKFIKKNPKISSFIFGFQKNIISFDTKPLKESLKGLELKNLEINGFYSTKDGLLPLLECFNSTKIETLQLNLLEFDDEKLKVISLNENIQTLKFLNINFNFKVLKTSLYTIKGLEFHSCSFTDEPFFLYDLLASCKSLKELNLSHNNFQIDFNYLYPSLKDKDLFNLTLKNIESIQRGQDFIKVISLPSKKIVLDSIEENTYSKIPIFKYLNQNLIHFYSSFTKNNLQGIDKYLNDNQKIESLEMINSGIEDQVKLLGNGISKNFSLKRINFNINEISKGFNDLMDGLSLNNRIEILEIIHNKLDDEHCSLLASYLSKNQHLKHLNLHNNMITEIGVEKLFPSLLNHSSLKALILGSNSIKNKSCLFLKEILKTNSNLRSLNIISCDINTEGFKHILEGLQYNTNLTELNASYNNFTDIPELLNLLFFNTGIIELNIDSYKFPKEYIDYLKCIKTRNMNFIKTLKIPIQTLNIHFNFK